MLRWLMAVAAVAAVGLGSAGVPAPTDHDGTGTDRVAVKCYDWCGSPQP